MVWGDYTEGKRITLTDPLPVQFAGQTGPINISGNIGGVTSSSFAVRNYGQDGSGASAALHYLVVAGNTSGTERVGITGTVEGKTGGIPVNITGGVNIMGSSDAARGVAIQGTSAGETASINGEIYPGYGFGIPVAVTGGRRLSSSTDSIIVSGTVNSTGGRQLSPATDSVACYGFDQGEKVYTRIYASDGTTLGHSGDALNVAVTNGNFSITANVSATVGVTNSDEPPLRVQGYTGSNGDPVTIRGENGGAVEVVSTSTLDTTVSNVVDINDTDIIEYLGKDTTTPIISKLTSIEKDTDQIESIRSDLSSGKVKTTIVAINRPNDIRSGLKIITNTAKQLHNNMELKSGVTVKASPTNPLSILVGNRNLINNDENGYLLEPGESIFLEVNNLNKIYIKIYLPPETPAPSGDTNIYYIGT
jgi:hypothetical protein